MKLRDTIASKDSDPSLQLPENVRKLKGDNAHQKEVIEALKSQLKGQEMEGKGMTCLDRWQANSNVSLIAEF